MIESGLIKEAKELYSLKSLKALNTIGYREVFNYIEDKLELENKSFEDADLDGLEILWQQAKGENL